MLFIKCKWDLLQRGCNFFLCLTVLLKELRLTGMLLANSSANTAEIASFWSSVNGTLAGGGTITGISADAGRGRLPDGDGERALVVDDCGLPRPVTLAMTSMALEAVRVQSART